MGVAEDIIYQNNYSLDKFIFTLTRNSEDEEVRAIDDHKDIIEFLIEENENNLDGEQSDEQSGDDFNESATSDVGLEADNKCHGYEDN